jgi:Ca2+-binding RTX toxin-like protein
LVAEAIDSNNLEDFQPDTDAPSQHGLVYEIVNPTSSQPVIYARQALGSMLHQAIAIDSNWNVYVNDQVRGAIFQFTPGVDPDMDPDFEDESPLAFGTLSVLVNDEFDTVGSSFWLPLDELVVQDNVREALDLLEVPDGSAIAVYQQPADMEIGRAVIETEFDTWWTDEPVFSEILYVAETGDNRVLGVDLNGMTDFEGTPFVRVFADISTIDAATDSAVDAEFSFPADLSVDAHGRVYIGEANFPAPGAGDPGNDVWVATDLDGDGAADLMGRLASLATRGAAPSGIYVNPLNPSDIYVNVQSPTSGNDAIFVLHQAVSTPSVTEVVNGNETVLVIVGSDGSDRITLSGDNIVNVRIGSKYYRGFAPSNDIIVYGQGGADRIITAVNFTFNMTVYGGDGSDYIATGTGDDTISGGAGNDFILAGHGNNVVFGNEGNDRVATGREDDYIDGGDGNDRLNGGDGNDIIYGGPGNDTIFGGRGSDFLSGGAGNDYIDGHIGDDLIIGGTGADFLRGGAGFDVLIGGLGADRVYGGLEDDLLIGEQTIVDDDDDALAELLVLWQDVFFDTADRASIVLDFLGGSIASDGSRDLLNGGGRGADLFFLYFGFDRAEGKSPDSELVNLADFS